MGTRILINLCAAVFLIGAVEAQQYYRWVDANGTVHFSETPPVDNSQAEAARIKASHITQGLSGSDASSAANAAPAAETSAQTPQDAENCAKVRGNLQTLNASQQVQRVDPLTGETRVMTAAENQAELERNQRLESIYC